MAKAIALIFIAWWMVFVVHHNDTVWFFGNSPVLWIICAADDIAIYATVSSVICGLITWATKGTR